MRTWAKKGEPISTKVKLGFKSFYMYSSISPFTGEDFTLILPGVCTDLMNIYLGELALYLNGRHAVLIMDQAGWHRSKELAIAENINIIFLPPYSPELNPVERFWKLIKTGCIHNRVFDDLDQMLEVVSDFIKSITHEALKQLCKCSYLLSYK